MKRTDSQYIPLNKLKKSPKNVRQVPHTQKHIEALAVSIQTHGPLQDPVVETERDGDGRPTGCYFVTIGEGRRLAHLVRVKRKWIKADHPIRCTIDDAHSPQAVSLAENELRSAMHPADQFVAFKTLVDGGQSVEEVAAQYSVTPLVVQRRLKLANVAPEFLALYREDKGITLEHLMALAITDDHARQLQVWKDLPGNYRSPHALRTALTQDEVPMSDPVARFVTLKAYERAGGVVRRDLFAEEDNVYLADRPLLEKLAQEKLEKHAAKLKAEGFAWTDVALRMDYSQRAAYGHVQTVRREPTEQEAQALASAHERLADIQKQAEQTEDSEKLQELDDAFATIDEEIEQLEEALEVPDPAQQARAGAIVTVGHDGKLQIERDRLKPDDARRTKGSTNRVNGEGAGRGTRGHSIAMTRRLTAHRTLALQASLAQQPRMALLALTHCMVLNEFYGLTRELTVLQVRTEPVVLRQDAPDIEQTKAQAVLHAQREKLRAELPEPEALFGWLTTQSSDRQLELLAFCVARATNAVQSDDRPGAFEELAAAAQLDMREWWSATANGYFSALPKEAILKVVREATSPEVGRPLELLKKANLVKAAEEKVAGTGWLPALLRAHAA